MAKLNIVLADSDELYLNRLEDYFMEKMSTFDVCAFTSKESFVKYISNKQGKTDIVMFTEEFMDAAITEANVNAKIILSEDMSANPAGFDAVNKYQKTEKLVNEILMIHAEKTGRVDAVSTGNKQTKVIGVYSPVGGCGKTTIALALAMYLGNIGKRVYYLNYEIINSTASVLKAAAGGSLSDVLLAVKTKGANTGLRIIANKYFDNIAKISYINPPESALEMNELTVQEKVKLIKEFEGLGEFDAVIVDFDNSFTPDKIDLLYSCDAVLTPFTPDDASIRKIKQMLREFTIHTELDELFRKIHLAVNKSDGRTNDTLRSGGILNQKSIEVILPLSPTLADMKNLAYAVGSMQGVFSTFAGSIFGGVL